MLIQWDDLGATAMGQTVTLSGYPVALAGQIRATRFLLTQEPGCCPGCAPRDPSGSVEVEAQTAIPLRAGALRLSGTWQTSGSRYRLTGARPFDPPGWSGVTRRRALMAGPLMCLAASAAPGDARAAIQATTTVDMHSHAGGIASVSRMHSGMAFGPVAEPMRKGGMATL